MLNRSVDQNGPLYRRSPQSTRRSAVGKRAKLCKGRFLRTALNRSAIGALCRGRCAERVLLRDFRGRVCAVGRGDLASIDRGFSP